MMSSATCGPVPHLYPQSSQAPPEPPAAFSPAAPPTRVPDRRLINVAGFAVCAALLGYALYAQFALHLEPCPLCIFQRIGIALLGLAFLAAALHSPRGGGRYVYAVLI